MKSVYAVLFVLAVLHTAIPARADWYSPPTITLYNYIVAGGAGTAGAVLCERLSANPNNKVLCINNGDDETDSPYDQAAYTTAPTNVPVNYPRFVDMYLSLEGPNIGRRTNNIFVPHVYGGGMAVNGDVFTRPANLDYDGLAALGITGWSSTEMGELWTGIETFHEWNTSIPVPPGHGTTGPINVIAIPPEQDIGAIFTNVLEATGAPLIPDCGLGNISGGCYYPRNLGGNYTIQNYTRQTMWAQYLRPVIASRPNLHFIGGATVYSVSQSPQCRCEDGRGNQPVCIDSVTYTVNGQSYTSQVVQGGEVILSTGALNTPKILFHSGIGPCSMIEEFGVDCLLNIPNMGQVLYEHVAIPLVYVSLIPSPNWPQRIGSIVGVYYAANSTEINIENAYLSYQIPLPGTPFGVGQFILNSVGLNKPMSTGGISLFEKDWTMYPNITLGVMANLIDLTPLVTAFKIARAATFDANIPYLIEEIPGLANLPLDSSDSAIEAWILSEVSGIYHTVATTPMGLCSAGATVDDNLRVCGVAGLRVADQGIFPYPYTGHTTATGACLIGAKASQLILGY